MPLSKVSLNCVLTWESTFQQRQCVEFITYTEQLFLQGGLHINRFRKNAGKIE